ncbi:hypothetical protein H696_02579 [Fonticula alba]|uniref:Choline kinase n=1 Tax=Fonticula alba TaxID=691883 RepID=A0A058Z7H2_FONAL|nr:hypothetical protein H696_02579 [Fonticula alba]KCV70249.1 hypothetical protein H696_02579 [Fonticula alba]|eukprot:XP_009494765.1 hypothetical protein H696_02579 [Fonticula alba]
MNSSYDGSPASGARSVVEATNTDRAAPTGGTMSPPPRHTVALETSHLLKDELFTRPPVDLREVCPPALVGLRLLGPSGSHYPPAPSPSQVHASASSSSASVAGSPLGSPAMGFSTEFSPAPTPTTSVTTTPHSPSKSAGSGKRARAQSRQRLLDDTRQLIRFVCERPLDSEQVAEQTADHTPETKQQQQQQQQAARQQATPVAERPPSPTSGSRLIEPYSDFKMRRLTGALSNTVYVCSSSSHPDILLRVYGSGSSHFFSRETELSIFGLVANYGLGPALMASFPGGRLEEFIGDARTIDAKSVRSPGTSRSIARAMARLHAIGLDYSPQARDHGFPPPPSIPGETPGVSSLFAKIRRWAVNLRALDAEARAAGAALRHSAEPEPAAADALAGAPTPGAAGAPTTGACMGDPEILTTRLRTTRLVSVADLQAELDWLEAKLEELETRDGQRSPIVFSHNDAQYGNILRRDGGHDSTTPHRTSDSLPTAVGYDGRVTMVDLEYAGFAPRGFDIGNHFCEWAADYHSSEPHVFHFHLYPSVAEQRAFIRAYLAEYRRLEALGSVRLDPYLHTDGPPPLEAEAAALGISSEEVDQVLLESTRYALVSHLLWILWGLISAHCVPPSEIDFDFGAYASLRWVEYWRVRDCVLGDLPCGSGSDDSDGTESPVEGAPPGGGISRSADITKRAFSMIGPTPAVSSGAATASKNARNAEAAEADALHEAQSLTAAAAVAAASAAAVAAANAAVTSAAMSAVPSSTRSADALLETASLHSTPSQSPDPVH